MKELNWNDYLDDGPVEVAYNDLKHLTSKSIALHSRSLVPGIRTAFWCSSRERIHIFVDEDSPTVCHGAVHEIIHAILMEQGYHRLTGQFDTNIRGTLSNELQHPEVFRRIEAYGLEMQPYWVSWEPELEKAFAEIWNNVHSHSGFWEFPQVFTWFFFPHASTPFLERYRQINPIVHEAAKLAFKDAQAVGLATKEAHLKYLAIFKEQWYRYCDSHLPKDGMEIDLLDAIATSITRPVSEIFASNTEQTIIDYLMAKGYVN